MALLLTLLIIPLVLGLLLTFWLVWRSGKKLAQKEAALYSKASASKKNTSKSAPLSLKLSIAPTKDKEIDWNNLRDALVLSDMGAELTSSLIDSTKSKVGSKVEVEEATHALKEELCEIMSGDNSLDSSGTPSVWLFVGVNGSGKTTSIAKLGHSQIQAGKKVVMAAADTFRAAAIEQLESWSKRVGAGFIKGQPGGDASAVVFDAIEHAKARGVDLVLVDTAGRLHTNTNLMGELEKIKRTAEKAGGRVTETLLVIDATTGQNGLNQAREFKDSVDVSGIILTKLDGSTKGGIVVAIANELGIQIKRVGVGEKPEDMIPFQAQEFVDSLI